MKHGLMVGLAALLVVANGCTGGGSAPAPTTTTTGSTTGATAPAPKAIKVGIVFDTGGRGDASFNDSAWRGIEKATTDFQITSEPIESRSEKDYATNLRTVADKGCDLVVAVGINMKTALDQVAPEYPDTKFAIIDTLCDRDNVRSILFKEEQGSFLVGYIAGEMTKTNKVGFVGGQELDLIKKFEVGYAAGVKTANPKAIMLPAKYTGGWDNVSDAKVAANSLYAAGADIVYHAAGRAGLGVFEAAKAQKKYAIGVDSDQDHLAEGLILTSMIKKVDEAVYQTIMDVRNGDFEAGAVEYDLKKGGVGVSEMRFTRDLIGEANLKKLADVEEKIKSGAIVVPTNREELAAFKP
jgi:basic membrane protein A